MLDNNRVILVRQGDVLLVACSAIPAKAKAIARENGRVILAHGEVTGHAHAISEKSCALLEHRSQRYLSVPKGAQIKHEEHATIAVPPGKYCVIRQVEYSPEEIRNVAD